MPWRRWSVSRAALKAVTGQFVGRQSVLGAAILCALATWFGASTDFRVDPRVAVTGLVMAAVGLTATIASTSVSWRAAVSSLAASCGPTIGPAVRASSPTGTPWGSTPSTSAT